MMEVLDTYLRYKKNGKLLEDVVLFFQLMILGINHPGLPPKS